MERIPDGDLKYVKFYQPNDLYWGLGIENETYFIANNPIEKTGSYLKKNRKRDRYSVDYNTSYDQDKLIKYLNKMFLDNDLYKIPQYINAHTFIKTDTKGEHQTLYTAERTPNPKFNGKTLQELIMLSDNILSTDFDNKYLFDGDTIEFITQDFYKTTVDSCVNELVTYKRKFLRMINEFMEFNNLPVLNYPKINFGLVQFRSNNSNISIFNNGTYHINITIPTSLDNNAKIADPILFEKQHKNAIKILKWIEPLIISIYGSPDVYSFDDDGRYSAGSLRLTASRYIGIGTYNTSTMKKGKLLQDAKTTSHIYQNSNSWYNQLYKLTDYKQGDHIGYDVNYAKHYNAGIEFRILDYFPEDALPDLINFIILLFDHSLENEITKSAYECQEWHNFTTNVLLNGYVGKIPYQLITSYHKILGFPLINEPNIKYYMSTLIDFLHLKYHNSYCSRCMSPNMIKPLFHNVNKYMWENNYLQYIPVNNKNHIRVLKLYDIYKNIKDPNNSFVINNNNRLHNLLISTKLHNFDNLNLEEFYAKLLELSKQKFDISKYILSKKCG